MTGARDLHYCFFVWHNDSDKTRNYEVYLKKTLSNNKQSLVFAEPFLRRGKLKSVESLYSIVKGLIRGFYEADMIAREGSKWERDPRDPLEDDTGEYILETAIEQLKFYEAKLEGELIDDKNVEEARNPTKGNTKLIGIYELRRINGGIADASVWSTEHNLMDRRAQLLREFDLDNKANLEQPLDERIYSVIESLRVCASDLKEKKLEQFRTRALQILDETASFLVDLEITARVIGPFTMDCMTWHLPGPDKFAKALTAIEWPLETCGQRYERLLAEMNLKRS